MYASAYVKPRSVSEHEDALGRRDAHHGHGRGQLSRRFPPSENWPGFAPGDRGVLNTMAPTHFDLTGIVDLPTKPPVLWIRGLDDLIVSDTSYFDLNFLGELARCPAGPAPTWLHRSR